MSRNMQGEILKNLRDGVLVIGAGGRIETVNPVARELLDLEKDLSGVVFAQAFIPRQGLDAFTERVIDVCTSRRKAERSLVDITTKAGKRTLSMAASYLLRGDKIASVIIVFSDVTEVRALRDAERAQHAELQKAYRDIEERNTELAVALRKVRMGMNALLQILIYKKENAIVVPIHTVNSWAAEHTVTVIDPATLERETRTVAIGPTTYDTVEIVSGLSEGETVLVR